MGLRLRLNLLLSVIFVATLGIGSLLLYNVLRAGVTEELTASVDQAAKLITVVVNQLPQDLSEHELQRAINEIASIGSTRHLRISTDPGTSLTEESESLAAPSWFFNLLAPEPSGLIRIIDLRSKRRRIIIRADATAEINEAWREAIPLSFTLVLFGLLANGLIYVLMGRSLAALEKVGGALEGMGEGDFSVDIPKVGVSDTDRIIERVNELAEALRRSQAEAQMWARRSMTIQEQERRNLSQALHDELGQSINAIKALGVAIKQRSDKQRGLDKSVQSIIDVSGEMYDQIRDMMNILRPPALDELGLRLALENMVDDWNSHHQDTFCKIKLPENLPTFSENLSISVFRIVQEALNNVAKHAAATEVDIVLLISSAAESRLRLTIEDNGHGFNLTTVQKGLGIHGIEERVDALGGELELISGAQGTQYKISIPIHQN
ncbi:MAG: ATP-binding protein [Pseudomonadota bacterium]